MKMLKYIVVFLALLFPVLWLIFILFTGPRNLDQYPEATASPYLLPWPGDEPHFCVQGNRAVVSHRENGEFSWDFTMPIGSPVSAARPGTVLRVVEHHTEHGTDKPNNLVVVKHEDGTLGNYLHIKQNGALVEVGDQVEQGDLIAESGHVGRSAMPHLHFHVTDPELNKTIPITFRDVESDQGIPRMFKTYVSGNRKLKH